MRIISNLFVIIPLLATLCNLFLLMTFLSARKLTVYTDGKMPWTLDGEREEGREVVEVRNLQHAIPLVRRVSQ